MGNTKIYDNEVNALEHLRNEATYTITANYLFLTGFLSWLIASTCIGTSLYAIDKLFERLAPHVTWLEWLSEFWREAGLLWGMVFFSLWVMMLIIPKLYSGAVRGLESTYGK